ncbi:hypothetical protein D9M68_694500 [compost metagenome]
MQHGHYAAVGCIDAFARVGFKFYLYGIAPPVLTQETLQALALPESAYIATMTLKKLFRQLRT